MEIGQEVYWYDIFGEAKGKLGQKILDMWEITTEDGDYLVKTSDEFYPTLTEMRQARTQRMKLAEDYFGNKINSIEELVSTMYSLIDYADADEDLLYLIQYRIETMVGKIF